jgi:WhiB family redox-sensing transcriptional regulator
MTTLTDLGCTVTGCDRPPHARGLCRLHYNRHREGRDVATPPRVVLPPAHRLGRLVQQHGTAHVATSLGCHQTAVEKALRRAGWTSTGLNGSQPATWLPPDTDTTPPAPDTRWMEHARCAETDPETFYPVGSSRAADYEPAKTICARCDVRNDCLRYALDTNEEHGVWGGLTPDERYALRQRRAEAC